MNFLIVFFKIYKYDQNFRLYKISNNYNDIAVDNSRIVKSIYTYIFDMVK